MAEVDIKISFNSKAIALVGIILLLAAGVGMYYQKGRQNDHALPTQTQIPSEKISQSDFPVYAPINPPADFDLDETSISSNGKIFVYSYSYDKGKRLSITCQPLPKDFDVNKFKPDKEVEIHIGRAYIVDLETRTTASIVTNDALIFLNAPKKISIDDLTTFMDSLRLAQ